MITALGLLFVDLGGGHHLFTHGHSGPPSEGLPGLLNCVERLLCVPFALTMCFAWLPDAFSWGRPWVPLFLFSMGSGALIFWMTGIFRRWSRKHRTVGRLFAGGAALTIVAGYVWTWAVGVPAVRDHIIGDCIQVQARAHRSWPDDVPVAPIAPDIFYCFPILPGIVASEHCFLYGPLMGDGSQDLWVCGGAGPKRVYGFMMWNH
jgi:hypothetical protein